ncbi:hypothetical protein AX14_008680 [Amanita brunnescens Koide BX004]|nr:hypothetical protein AX14_009202 [Amanita brunnescens Koide BX004]KAF8724696.1 hypothetical protein AX14_008680 [Amanita brunnescens Koide BX004]
MLNGAIANNSMAPMFKAPCYNHNGNRTGAVRDEAALSHVHNIPLSLPLLRRAMLLLEVFWLALAAVPAVVAQVASCTDSNFHWTYNSLGQDPCDVAMVLSQPCGGGYTFGPLVSGQEYTPAEVNDCTCNTVRYSLISACAACQDGTWLPFSNYSKSCTQRFVQQYPETIPSNTRVPHWAYLTLSSSGTFDIVAASSAGGTESSDPAPTSTTSTSTSASSTSASTSALGSTRKPKSASTSTPALSPSNSSPSSSSDSSSSSSSNSSSSSSKSNTGTIVGGAVGGVIGGALIAALAFWFYTKHKSARGTASEQGMLASPPPSSWTPNSAVYQTPLRPYDPDDPSTFPPSREQLVQISQMSMGSLHSADRGQRYTGIPEF